MIVDCYTCVWDSPTRLGRGAASRLARRVAGSTHSDFDGVQQAGVEQHLAAAEPVDTTIVLGFKSAYLEAEVSDEFVSEYVARHPDRLIGFSGIDPADPVEAVRQMRFAHDELKMRGVGMSPAAQNFHPCHTNAKTCYEAASGLGMPVLFHTGLRDAPECVMQYAQSVLLDEVAREFPDLKIIIAHMGFPWVNETIVLLAKHPNVFADISWLLHQPWQAYQALLGAYQHGVMHKLLFGSGYPYTDAASCIEALYGINHMVKGTSLPAIPREQLRGIVERDALDLLGIGKPKPSNGDNHKSDSILDDDN